MSGSPAARSECIILCEGFYDRAFWAGWLEHLGCEDRGLPLPGSSQRRPVYDPSGKRVGDGQFALYTPSEGFVRIVPCHGKDIIWGQSERRIRDRHMDPLLSRLVVNRDADVLAGATEPGGEGIMIRDVLVQVQRVEVDADLNDDGDIELGDGATIVSLVRWEAHDKPARGLPEKQTLERLVCAAMAAAYPDRPAMVATWLAACQGARRPDPKAYAWSYMAGWYAERGCADFYREVWRDEVVRKELQERLERAGSWRVAQAIAQ